MIFYEWYSSSCRWNDLHMFVLDILYKVTKNSWRSWFIYVWITYRPYNLLNSNYLSFQKIRIRKYNGNKGVKFVLIRNEHSSSLNSFFLANQGERMNEICKFDPPSDGKNGRAAIFFWRENSTTAVSECRFWVLPPLVWKWYFTRIFLWDNSNNDFLKILSKIKI